MFSFAQTNNFWLKATANNQQKQLILSATDVDVFGVFQLNKKCI
jgi:hypothetical protein